MQRPADKETWKIETRCVECGFEMGGKSTYSKVGDLIHNGCDCGGSLKVLNLIFTGNCKEVLERTVKPQGNSCHVSLPKNFEGKKVIIILPEKE